MHDQKETVTAAAPDAKARLLAKLDKALDVQRRASDLLYDVSVDLPKDLGELVKVLDEGALERFLEIALRAGASETRAQTGAGLSTSSIAKATTIGTAIDTVSRVTKRVREKMQQEDDATCQCTACKSKRGRA